MTPHPVAVVVTHLAALGLELAFVEEGAAALSALAGIDAWSSGTFLFSVPTLLIVVAGCVALGGLLSELWHRRMVAELARREAAIEERRWQVVHTIVELVAAVPLDLSDVTFRRLVRWHRELTDGHPWLPTLPVHPPGAEPPQFVSDPREEA